MPRAVVKTDTPSWPALTSGEPQAGAPSTYWRSELTKPTERVPLWLRPAFPNDFFANDLIPR